MRVGCFQPGTIITDQPLNCVSSDCSSEATRHHKKSVREKAKFLELTNLRFELLRQFHRYSATQAFDLEIG